MELSFPNEPSEFIDINSDDSHDMIDIETSKYKIISKLGEGAFGEVLQASKIRGKSEEVVALKKVPIKSSSGIPKACFREIQSLRQLNHPNVIPLYDVFADGTNVTMVFEYMPSDLGVIIQRSQSPLMEGQVLRYLYMLLQGLHHCHSNGIIHRDIKPSNILLSESGVLKIGDFGLARTYDTPQLKSYSHQAMTRWYRAPELLFGGRWYGPGVDLWGAGAVMAELLTLRPLLPGNSDIDQLHLTLTLLGTPNEAAWPGVKDLPDYDKIYFRDMPPQPLEMHFPGVSPTVLSLLEKLLSMNPDHRPSAFEALKNEAFLGQKMASLRNLPLLKRRNNQQQRNDGSMVQEIDNSPCEFVWK